MKIALDTMVCSTTVRKQVQDIVAHEKMKRTLGHDWGFDESEYYSNVQMSGRRYLFRGPRGVGVEKGAVLVEDDAGGRRP